MSLIEIVALTLLLGGNLLVLRWLVVSDPPDGSEATGAGGLAARESPSSHVGRAA